MHFKLRAWAEQVLRDKSMWVTLTTKETKWLEQSTWEDVEDDVNKVLDI